MFIQYIMRADDNAKQGANTIYIQDHLAGPSGSRATIPLFLTVVFYYRAERPLKSTVEKPTTSEDMVLKVNLAGLEKIRSPYHLYLFRPERALFTSRMSPHHLMVNLASPAKIQSPYHPYLFRPERALFTSRMNPRVPASSRNVVSVESSSLV